jgi:hypothetical protein
VKLKFGVFVLEKRLFVDEIRERARAGAVRARQRRRRTRLRLPRSSAQSPAL